MPTFRKVANEWYDLKKSSWAPSNQRTMRQRIDARLLSQDIADKPMVELKAADFIKLLRNIEASGHYEMAHRVSNICDRICTFAKLSGIIDQNPVTGMSTILHPVDKGHRSAITDPQKIGELLRAIQLYPGSTVTKYALLIMPYVFVRSLELRGTRWEELDFENRQWIIPAERMKMKREHIVPLSDQVISYFKELQSISPKSDFCFPSRMTRTRILSDVALLNALRRMDYGKEEMCIHGFRSTASTLLNEQGYDRDVIEIQLAHVDSNRIRGAYNRALYLDERKKMMQEWADYLDSLRDNARGQ